MSAPTMSNSVKQRPRDETAVILRRSKNCTKIIIIIFLYNIERDCQSSEVSLQLIVGGGGDCPPGCWSFAELQAIQSAEARRLLEVASSEGGPPPGPNDVCLIMFSSGTTGPQKAVQLPHRSLLMQGLYMT